MWDLEISALKIVSLENRELAYLVGLHHLGFKDSGFRIKVIRFRLAIFDLMNFRFEA